MERSKSVPVGKQNGDIEIPVIHIKSDDESSQHKKKTGTSSRRPKERDDLKGRTFSKAQTQFRPITGAPLSDSETDSRSKKETPPVAPHFGVKKDAKSFVPVTPAAAKLGPGKPRSADVSNAVLHRSFFFFGLLY